MTGPGDAAGGVERGTTGAADWLWTAAAFGLAFAVRGVTWPAVFTAGGIRLVGPDAHYHLRRITWTVENFPQVLARDPYVRFPDGGEPIWTPFFDQAIAAIARLAVGPGDPEGVERLAVWVPPVLGALTAVATYWIGRRFFGRRVGAIAAGLYCLLPSPIHYAQVGLVDHHVAVALFGAGLLAALLAVVSRTNGGTAAPAVLGAAVGACLLLWPGTLLLVGVVQSVLAVSVLGEADARDAARRAGDAAVTHGVAFLLVAPLAIGHAWSAWSDVSPVVLSSFQPLWLGLPALGFGICAVAWHTGFGGGGPGRRAVELGGALVLPLALAAALPAVRAGVVDAFTWFFRSEQFQAVVAESLPLLWNGRSFVFAKAIWLLTPFLLAAPALLAALVVTDRHRRLHRTLALWCAVLLAATFAQQRFANSLGVPWALVIACGLDLGVRGAAARGPRVRRGTALAAALALALAVLPLATRHLVELATALRAWAGEQPLARERVSHHESLVAAARWLREHSPPTAGWTGPGEPEYGVLTAWGDGHVVRYVAQRPTVQDNFGDDVGRERFDEAERYFSAPSEREAIAVATGLRARYALVRETGSGHAPRAYAPRSLQVRLHRLRGSAGRVEGAAVGPGAAASSLRTPASITVPALTRHRLVYESPPRAQEPGRYKLYEIVEGALVVGRTLPRQLVEARLRLASGSELSFEYRAHSQANAAGRYEIRLPYPTEAFGGRFTAQGAYSLEAAGVSATLAVDDPAVRRGALVEGPTLVP